MEGPPFGIGRGFEKRIFIANFANTLSEVPPEGCNVIDY